MKITAITTMMLMAGAVAQGADQRPERNVTVCIKGSAASGMSQAIASKIFAGIGVTINWRGQRGCPSQGILISLSDETPASLLPGALAYALPYEGVHIRLFYDRIAQYREPCLVVNLLAHVLVHEITHILQVVSRHSHHGIMKARWEREDFDHMVSKPLAFTDEDIDLIHRGLAARAARTTLAMNAAPATVAVK